MGRLLLLATTAVLVGSCSFTTATGFNECTIDTQCGPLAACLDGYCIPLPERCEKTEGVFDQPDRIPLAALLPLTDNPDGGTRDDSELQGLNAIRLAISEVNALEGLVIPGPNRANRRYGLFSCNTGRNSDVIASQTQWFVQQLRVPAIMTSGSGQTAAAANEKSRADAGTMIISATATSPDLVDLYRLDHTVWRVAPPDTLQAKVIVGVLRSEPLYAGLKRIGVIYEDSRYGKGLGFAVQRELDASDGGFTVTLAQFTPPADANGVLNSFATPPQATVLVGFPEDIKLIIRAGRSRPAFSNHPWLFTDSAKDPAIVDFTTLPELAGKMGTAPAQGAGSAFSTFRLRFKDKFHGVDPNDYSFTSHSYDEAYLVMLSSAWSASRGAITTAGMNEGMTKLSQPGGAQQLLLSTNWQGASLSLSAGTPIDVEGSSGKLDFDLDAGAPAAPYELWRIDADGGFTTVRLITP